ncbi:MAG: HIT family protein [Deltaproteobacteria bacterium]|nr:MAG: HIT family protein [Deltaproteobacteria bacterium]
MTDYKEDCLFCRMLTGKEKCLKLYEDDSTLVIVDIGQVIKKDGGIIPGRSLVIPKRHVVHYYELEDEEAGRLFIAATKIARKIKKAFDPAFVTVFIRGQQVAHSHIILQPSTGEGDPIDAMFMGVRDFFKIASEDVLIQMARKINEA